MMNSSKAKTPQTSQTSLCVSWFQPGRLRSSGTGRTSTCWRPVTTETWGSGTKEWVCVCVHVCTCVCVCVRSVNVWFSLNRSRTRRRSTWRLTCRRSTASTGIQTTSSSSLRPARTTQWGWDQQTHSNTSVRSFRRRNVTEPFNVHSGVYHFSEDCFLTFKWNLKLFLWFVFSKRKSTDQRRHDKYVKSCVATCLDSFHLWQKKLLWGFNIKH